MINGYYYAMQWRSKGFSMKGVGGGLGKTPTATGGHAAGVWRQSPIRRRQGVWGGPPALGDFCNFSVKITHFYIYFGQIAI